MEGRSNNKNRITKTRDFPWESTEKLGSSKNINRKGKRNHEEAVWQEKMKFLGVKTKRQCMAGS